MIAELKKEQGHRETRMLKIKVNICNFRKENQVNECVVMDKHLWVDGWIGGRKKALMLVCVGDMLVVR